MESAKWYFTHESEEDQLWYGIFFSMCKKFGISWPKATSTQKAFIEEITRVNYERELFKRELQPKGSDSIVGQHDCHNMPLQRV